MLFVNSHYTTVIWNGQRINFYVEFVSSIFRTFDGKEFMCSNGDKFVPAEG